MADNDTPGPGSSDRDAPNIVSPRMPEDGVPRRACGAMVVHRRMLNESAAYRDARSALENATRAFLAADGIERFEGPVRIPVVVHVVFNTDVQNISDEQVHSQIDVLNQDFRGTNADTSIVPPRLRGADRRQPRRVLPGQHRPGRRADVRDHPHPHRCRLASTPTTGSRAARPAVSTPGRPTATSTCGSASSGAACSATRSSRAVRPRPTAWSSSTAGSGRTGPPRRPSTWGGRRPTRWATTSTCSTSGATTAPAAAGRTRSTTPPTRPGRTSGCPRSRTSPAATGPTATCSTTTWTTPTTGAWSCSPPARRPAWTPASTVSAPGWSRPPAWVHGLSRGDPMSTPLQGLAGRWVHSFEEDHDGRRGLPALRPRVPAGPGAGRDRVRRRRLLHRMGRGSGRRPRAGPRPMADGRGRTPWRWRRSGAASRCWRSCSCPPTGSRSGGGPGR